MMLDTAIPVRLRSAEIIVAPMAVVPVSTKRVRGLRALLGFVALLFAVNFVFALLLEAGPVHLRDPEYGLRLNALRERRREHPNRKLTVVLGSSRTAMGIRPDVYEAGLASPGESPLLFNMSMAGAGPVFQLMTLERLIADGVKPDAVLLEFWPALLRGDGDYREERRLNVERLRTADEPIVAEYFADSGATRERMRSNRALPVWYHRRALLNRYWPEALPRQERTDATWAPLDGWGWLPGRVSATHEQIEGGWPQVVAFYDPLFHSFEVSPVADRALRACLARCKELETDVSLIALPESARFRSLMTPESIRLSNEYRRRLQLDCGVPLIDGSPWADDAALPDGFHLTQDGAGRFTRELAGHIAPQK